MKYQTYRQLDREVDHYFSKKKYSQAIELLREGMKLFPEKECEALLYISICYRENKDYQKCTDNLIKALDKGYYYDIDSPWWSAIKETTGYEDLLTKTRNIRDEQNRNVKVKYEIFTPSDYNDNQLYPLVMIQHGDNNDLNITKECWLPEYFLEKGFVIAYIQSSQKVSSKGFIWTNDYEQSIKDMKQSYDQVLAQYSIDKSKVILAGFSGGSMASLYCVLANHISVKGFICLCPSMIPNLTDDNIQGALNRGMKGVIFEGEMNKGEEDIQKILQKLKQNKFPLMTVFHKSAGHWYPEDWEFKKMTQQALDYIME
ncbi:MAG: hypothetical protein MJB14_09640 [Spirochaetes bacterium]|nr:hypothetical protein [Spirochaetota bacterium]